VFDAAGPAKPGYQTPNGAMAMNYFTISIAAAALITIIGNAQALDVSDIMDFGAPIPACLDIADAYEIRRIRALTQDGFGRQTITGRTLLNNFVDDARTRLPDGSVVQSCHWLRAGDVRYVAEKRVSDARSGGAFFCLGWLVAGTNTPDKTKPCHWVYLADTPTRRPTQR
jgi:hypothetical protein